MLILIHGENVAESEIKLSQLLKRDIPCVRFDVTNEPIEKLIEHFENKELFSSQKIILIEKLFEVKTNTKQIILQIINRYRDDPDITAIIHEPKKIDHASMKKINPVHTFFYDLPKYYYLFLDSLYPGNGVKTREFYIYALKDISAEQLFYSVIKRMRILLEMKTGMPGSFQDIKTMSPWQLNKFKSQARLWTTDKLVDLYEKLFNIEFDMKTSSLPLQLSSHIDILLLSI